MTAHLPYSCRTATAQQPNIHRTAAVQLPHVTIHAYGGGTTAEYFCIHEVETGASAFKARSRVSALEAEYMAVLAAIERRRPGNLKHPHTPYLTVRTSSAAAAEAYCGVRDARLVRLVRYVHAGWRIMVQYKGVRIQTIPLYKNRAATELAAYNRRKRSDLSNGGGPVI